MGKSSSSRKKRSKYSSLDRGRKRSKTKRAKSRKHRRHDDSDSESYSTDDSRSSASISLSSEDSYRGRKSRSSIRKDTKEKTKRRAWSCSSSSEESFHLRKKKGSRQKVDSKLWKKALKHKKKKKKKSKRDASVSSRSCSTRESSSESSDGNEYESHRGRSERRKSDFKSSKNVKGRSKKRRYRSRSCSSSSRDSDIDYWREKKETDVNISKRLKSIITIVDNDKEEREPDEYKEEIVYEDDSYPSSRSNDSAGNKRSTENEESNDLLEGKPTSDDFVMKDSLGEKINEISEASGDANEDLETILRQKALENLKRFRGQKQINSNDNSAQKDESGGASRSSCLQVPESSQNDLKNSCNPGIERDSAHSLQEEKNLDSKNGSSSGPTSKVAAAMREKEKEKEKKTLDHGVSRQRLVTSALKQALSNSTASTVELPKVKMVNESRLGELNVTSDDGNTNCDDGGLQGEDKEKRTVKLAVNNDSGSNSAAQDMNSSEGQAQVKEGSQLEEKTMSVMRGGELVQVSYKVYIPKKAPALARRQLKR